MVARNQELDPPRGGAQGDSGGAVAPPVGEAVGGQKHRSVGDASDIDWLMNEGYAGLSVEIPIGRNADLYQLQGRMIVGQLAIDPPDA